ncbi:MAG: LamG domain-containing protein [Nanoarchaeota archaeon]|nr:LamG domain-containing protein [Nanoarchaeota archaeon]
MSEVFNMDFRKGTFIEKYGNTFTKTGTNKLKNLGKGFGLECDGSNSIHTGVINETLNTVVLEFYLRTEETATTPVQAFGSFDSYGWFGFGNFTGAATDETFSWLNEGTTTRISYIKENLSAGYHQIILVWNGTYYDCWLDGDKKTVYNGSGIQGQFTNGSFYIGEREGGGFFTGSVLRVIADNSSVNYSKVADYYNEFVHSYNICPPKRNFVLNKGINPNETGLVAAYNMEPVDGEVIDISNNLNTGTIHGGAVATLDGISFDGVDDYVEKDSAPVTDYPYTLTSWVNTSTSATRSISLWVGDKDQGDEWGCIGIESDNKALFFRRAAATDELTGTTDIDDGKWHFVVGVATSATDVELYVDGVSEGTSSVSKLATGWDRVSIGRAGDSSPALYWNGELGEQRIYNKALSQSEVEALYNIRARQKLLVEKLDGIGADNISGTHL